MIAPAPRAPSRSRRPVAAPTPALGDFLRCTQLYGPSGSRDNAAGKAARSLYHATAAVHLLTPEQQLGFIEYFLSRLADLGAGVRVAGRVPTH